MNALLVRGQSAHYFGIRSQSWPTVVSDMIQAQTPHDIVQLSYQTNQLSYDRWNQNQALSQRMPRVTKTEGSPIKVILTRRGPRAWRTAEQTSRNRETKRSSDGRPQTISYRLPKLPENVLAGSTPSHPYVYKETFNESHFLLRKDDPPRWVNWLWTVMCVSLKS